MKEDSNKISVYLYVLKQKNIVKYVGLTKNPQSRKQNHKNNKPKHKFIVLQEFFDVLEATEAEKKLIKEYGTVEDGWNISPGGEYETNSGYNRKGIGGVRKGTIPWNKGVKNCFPKSLVDRFKRCRKGVIFFSKLSVDTVEQIRRRYEQHEIIESVGSVSKNGKKFTQERVFAKKYHKEYGITEANLYKIIKGKSWNMKYIKQIHNMK